MTTGRFLPDREGTAPMTLRECLPDRRPCFTQKVRINNVTVYLTCGEYPDGRLAEIFITIAKAGSALRDMTSQLAVFMSVALQHGTPLPILLDSLRDKRFEPAGEVRGSEHVTSAHSILDYVAQEIERSYPGGKRAVTPEPEEKAAGYISQGGGW